MKTECFQYSSCFAKCCRQIRDFFLLLTSPLLMLEFFFMKSRDSYLRYCPIKVLLIINGCIFLLGYMVTELELVPDVPKINMNHFTAVPICCMPGRIHSKEQLPGNWATFIRKWFWPMRTMRRTAQLHPNYFPKTIYSPVSTGAGISPFEKYSVHMRTINQ